MTETLFPKSSKRKIDALVQAILPSNKRKINEETAKKSSKRKRNNGISSKRKKKKNRRNYIHVEEDKLLSKRKRIDVEDDKSSKRNDVDFEEEDKLLSKRNRIDVEENKSSKRNDVDVEEEMDISSKGRKRIDFEKEENKSSKRRKSIEEFGDTVNLSHHPFEEDKLLRNDVDECFLEEEEDKLLKNDVGECFVEQDDEAKESDTVNLSNLPFEEDKLSRNAVGECFVEQDDEAKESEFGDTDLPFEEDDLEDDEAFIQFGDTDDLSHLLLGVVEDKSSLVGKCFQEETKCFQEDDEAKETFIQIGDKVDLSDLLFTKYRDYLITCSHQDIEKPVKVKAKDLAGKFILLHFMYLTDYFDTWSWQAPIANLEDLYTKLHPNGDFEIVFVALRDDHAIPSTTRQHLQHIFLMMPPCPAIPLSDRKSIQRLERMFGIQNARHFSPTSFIIDPTGVVLQSHATPLFLSYGAAAYPFTNERIQFLASEDSLFRTQPLSVEKLLSSPDRDYLINNKGEQVPLHNLDDKVVGLYFCPCLDRLSTTRDLEVVYQELSQKKEDFEIVLIYTQGWCEHDDYCSLVGEGSFLNIIKTMPWLALPFKDTNCIKKLQRILQYPQGLDSPKPDARLVIIGPHGEFLEPLGTQILLTYGASAYPFSFLSAVNLVLERAKKVKPEMLWELEAMFRQSTIGYQVRFSQFVGKRIIVFYETSKIDEWVYSNTLGELNARYLEMKGTDDEFEVIHILCDGMFSSGIKAPMPWLMHPPFDKDRSADKFMHCIFGRKCGLLAFDADGSVVRVTTSPQLGDQKSFPFYNNGNMENEVLLDVKENIAFRLECVYKGCSLFSDD